ncbi:hypothetical protein ACROAE_03345 [Shewanella sp. MF05960]|uniref:hypothetical protein n=1 Tax=Shewanella sp. MF05960 TaxID=3434874 RepID=UPI003D7B32A3
MTSINERVINFYMTETSNYRCGYCYSIWEHNDPQAELHHSSRDLQSLLPKPLGYLFSANSLLKVLGDLSFSIHFSSKAAGMLVGAKQ